MNNPDNTSTSGLSNPRTFEEAKIRYGVRSNTVAHPFDPPPSESASEQTLELFATPDATPEEIGDMGYGELEEFLTQHPNDALTSEQLVATSFAAAAALNGQYDCDQTPPTAVDVALSFTTSPQPAA